MGRHIYAAFCVCCLLNGQVAGADLATSQKLYLDAVSRIKSYDVVLQIDSEVFSDAAGQKSTDNKPTRIASETLRDVFAIGIGRRVERSLDDPQFHSIAVKNWATAGNDGKSLSTSLSYAIDGMNYFDYYNPNCSGYFLTELLRDEVSKVKMLESLPGTNYLGLEVSHRDLHGPVRFWIDPQRGYMPVVIERYARSEDGKVGLLFRSEVQSFAENGRVFAPERATLTAFNPGESSVGSPSTRFLIKADIHRSSWNSTSSAKQFDADSLSVVNNVEFGWKTQLPQVLLEAAERRAELRQEIMYGVATRTSRVLFIAINAAIILALATIVLWTRLRHRRTQESAA